MIREARVSDGAALQEVERRAGEQFRSVGMAEIADDEPFPIEVLADYATAGRAWVALDQADAIVGYVLVAEVDGCAHIEQVSVVPERQGEGVGKALVDRVRSWAAVRARPGITLTTFTDVPWNRPLYEHLGFRVLREDEIGAGLRAVREKEAVDGLDPAIRVCMRLELQ